MSTIWFAPDIIAEVANPRIGIYGERELARKRATTSSFSDIMPCIYVMK